VQSGPALHIMLHYGATIGHNPATTALSTRAATAADRGSCTTCGGDGVAGKFGVDCSKSGINLMRGVRGPGWAATHPQKLVAASVAGGVPRLPQQPPQLVRRGSTLAGLKHCPDLGCGRIVVSEIEVPILFENPV
jgi:hypothetical protein